MPPTSATAPAAVARWGPNARRGRERRVPLRATGRGLAGGRDPGPPPRGAALDPEAAPGVSLVAASAATPSGGEVTSFGAGRAPFRRGGGACARARASRRCRARRGPPGLVGCIRNTSSSRSSTPAAQRAWAAAAGESRPGGAKPHENGLVSSRWRTPTARRRSARRGCAAHGGRGARANASSWPPCPYTRVRGRGRSLGRRRECRERGEDRRRASAPGRRGQLPLPPPRGGR
jgi:hypothetical protein